VLQAAEKKYNLGRSGAYLLKVKLKKEQKCMLLIH
jgi:hypothetical protein